MKKNFLLCIMCCLLTGSLWSQVCYDLSVAPDDFPNPAVLSIRLVPSIGYFVNSPPAIPPMSPGNPNANWTGATITLSWDASLAVPNPPGGTVIESVAAQNGWPFIATGAPVTDGGRIYQKFSMTSNYNRALTAGVPEEILQITVSHPTIELGDFSLDPAPPAVSNDASHINFFGNEYATGTCGLDVVDVRLPVELLTFRASPDKNQQVQLDWTTASEENFSHFDLERSTDGRTFSKISETKGKGEIQNAYAHTDRNVKSGTVYYYRLKMLDLDGQFEYSHLVQAALEGSGLVLIDVYPNPANDYLNVRYNTEEESDVLIKLIDINGRVIYVSDIISAKGLNTTTLDLADQPSGMYWLSIKHGENQVNQRIVKTD